MKLTEVTLSYPFVRYKIDVTHFTARRSTAIEWLILEIVQRIQLASEYQGMTIENFFSSMFGITDTNQMIRPCLLNLRDIGALQLDSIYDQTDMSQTLLSQLHLTPVGAAMQRDGKLPGADSTDRIIFYYHATASQLIRDSKNAYYQEKPNGIPVREIENAEEIAFPTPLVSNTIDILKEQKDRPSWLEKETVIRQMIPAESELLWKNVIKSFNIGEEMRCSIEGNENTDVDATALSGLDLHEPDVSIPIVHVNNPDDEFNVILPSDQLQTLIDRIDNRGNLFIADANLCLDSIRTITGGKTNVNIRILCNAEETHLKIERGLINISIAESLLPDGLVYLDTTQAVGRGVFSLSAGNVSRLAELAYIPKEIGVDLKTITLKCVDRLYHEHPGMLHIFRVFGMQTEEANLIEKHINSLSSIEEKLRCLTQLNEESLTLFKSKCVSDEKVNSLILDVEGITSEITDVSSVQRVLERYVSIDSLKNRPSTIETLLHILLSNIKESDNLSDVFAFWKQIQNIGKQYIKFINQDGLYQNLYSDAVLNELVSKFSDEDLYELEPYTQFETLIRDMRNNTDRLQEMLELSMFEDTSEERLTEAVLLHRSELEKLIDSLEIWRNLLDSFNSRIGDFEEVAADCPALVMTDRNFQKLSSVLSLFCCDKSLRFSRICILDTNALMHMPELFNMLDGKDTMVIVPQMMLTELDGLKKDEDEETAYQAREAIRQIDNYSLFDWIDLKEQSNTELLSNDLDPDNPDCRIISVALKYVIHKPILITDDGNMRNIAKSQGIATMTTEGLAANIQQAEREQKQEKNNKKSKKKRKR